MQAAVIKAGNADIAEALVEGIVKAENEALKETVAMLVYENEQLRIRLGLEEWKKAQEREEKLCRMAERSRKAAKAPWYLKIVLAVAAFARELK